MFLTRSKGVAVFRVKAGALPREGCPSYGGRGAPVRERSFVLPLGGAAMCEPLGPLGPRPFKTKDPSHIAAPPGGNTKDPSRTGAPLPPVEGLPSRGSAPAFTRETATPFNLVKSRQCCKNHREFWLGIPKNRKMVSKKSSDRRAPGLCKNLCFF